MGKNGSGKSTLLRTLSKVQKKLGGNVFIHQQHLNSYSQQDLAKIISLVLTERLPESQLTVLEIVALGRQPHTNWLDQLSQNDIHKVEWALNLTGVKYLKNKPFLYVK